MKSRTAISSDRLLERWADWRITEELYTGTGPSSLVRFLEPPGSSVSGSVPLFFGRGNPRMTALNGDLVSQLGHWQINILLALYGLPGEERHKRHRFGIGEQDVLVLRKQARAIARHHTPSYSHGGYHEAHESDRETTG